MRARFLAAFGVSTLLLSCGGAPPPAAPGGRTLTLAVRADVTGIYPNPPVVSEAFTFNVNRSLFETLVRLDGRLQLAPGLAARWENPDDTTYVFTLRDDARFSDGRPVRAEDVAASLRAALERHWMTEDYLQAISTARALDERRVEVRTRYPYLGLLTRLPWGLVLPADAVAATPVPAIGSGPYRLVSWTPGREIVLARNPHHPRPPAYDRAVFRVEPDAARRLALVESGEADVADAVPLSELERLRAHPRVELVTGSGARVLFLCLRADQAPFSDPRVREAIDLAIDRREVLARALMGHGEVATQVVPPSIAGFNPSLTASSVQRDRARRLLAEAGFPRGLALRLDGPSDRYVNDRQILQEVARQLALVGVSVEAAAQPKATFFPLIESGRSPFHLLGFACESGDAGDILNSLFHSPAAGGAGRFNSLGLADERLDRLIEAADRGRTTRDRQEALQAALARVAELRVALPLLVQPETVAISRRVRWQPPLGLALFPEAMAPAEP